MVVFTPKVGAKLAVLLKKNILFLLTIAIKTLLIKSLTAFIGWKTTKVK